MIIELTETRLKTLTFAAALKLLQADQRAEGRKVAQLETTSRVDIGDGICKGLTIRTTKNETKSWSFSYTSPATKKTTRATLGVYGPEEHGGVSLDAARIKANALKTGVANRVDPKVAKLEAAPVMTFGAVMQMRLDEQVIGFAKGAELIVERYKRTFAKLLHLPIKSFKIHPHFNDLIADHLKAERLRTCDVIRSDLICIFDFAIGKGFLDINPVAKTSRRNGDDRRERALSPEEIAILWHSLPDAFSPRMALICKLLLTTGQRSGEIAGMHDSEIIENSPTDWVWMLPGDTRSAKTKKLIEAGRTKNGKAHSVPLSPLAIKLIKEARSKAKGPYLFAGTRRTVTSSRDVADAVWKVHHSEINDFGVADWTPHALRHTVVTGMGALGISLEDRGRVVNHSKATAGAEAQPQGGWGGVSTITKRYDHHDYLEVKRAALEKWGQYLAELVGEDIDGPKLRLVA